MDGCSAVVMVLVNDEARCVGVCKPIYVRKRSKLKTLVRIVARSVNLQKIVCDSGTAHSLR